MQGAKQVTILLVEDSPDDAFIFKRTLAKTGQANRFFSVTHGTAAVEYLKAAVAGTDPNRPRPDIIFLDIKMPQLSGFDVLAWIGKQLFAPPLHVIVLSGSDEQRDKKLALKLGAAAFLTKPISTSLLKEKLMEIAGEESGAP